MLSSVFCFHYRTVGCNTMRPLCAVRSVGNLLHALLCLKGTFTCLGVFLLQGVAGRVSDLSHRVGFVLFGRLVWDGGCLVRGF